MLRSCSNLTKHGEVGLISLLCFQLRLFCFVVSSCDRNFCIQSVVEPLVGLMVVGSSVSEIRTSLLLDVVRARVLCSSTFQ